MRALLTVMTTAAALTVVAATTTSAAPPARSTTKHVHLCHGHRPTIAKGKRRNLIIGTRHRDIIWAGRGRDVILGRGGDDLICGGPGADIIDGARGLDRIYGGRGFDRCFAPTRREHLLHHGCETHIVGTIRGNHHHKPPPPKRAIAMHARLAAARGGGFYADADEPTCTQIDANNTLTGHIDFGNFYFTAEYTDPGWVAFRVVYDYQQADGSWSADQYAPWHTASAPNDGQTYQIGVGAYNVPDNTYITGYQVYWWNGSSWSDGELLTFDSYHWEQVPFGVSEFSTCIT
jgi:hypothetical protein